MFKRLLHVLNLPVINWRKSAKSDATVFYDVHTVVAQCRSLCPSAEPWDPRPPTWGWGRKVTDICVHEMNLMHSAANNFHQIREVIDDSCCFANGIVASCGTWQC